MFKKIFSIFLIPLLVASLSACHTAQGFGKDVEQGGKAIEKATTKDKK